MLTIDGSSLEGGGQIVRSAVALSAITGKPISVTNIRAARSRPGLAAQHIAAVRAVAGTCNAACSGLITGSSGLTFSPGQLQKNVIEIDVGTAGSVSLVIQAWLPVALLTGGSLRVTGGTEVAKSPTIDYIEHVYCQVLRHHGARITIAVEKRGYYPKGGGCVTVSVEKNPITPLLPGTVDGPCGISSCSSNLPDHVAKRQADAAVKTLPERIRARCGIHLDQRTGFGTGSSCTVWRGAKGGSSLGKRGLPAETVGKTAAMEAVREFESPGTVDIHLSDQLLLPLALFGGSFTASTSTLHAKTQCWLLEQFGYRIRCRCNGIREYSA